MARVTIDFFTGNTVLDDGRAVGDILSELAAEGQTCQLWKDGRFAYEIRNLGQAGKRVKGVFAKFRSDQIPHAGEPGGKERELDLGEGEGLLEKNFFLFDKPRNLIAFQRNGNASRISKLGEYLSALDDKTITFDPVLKPEATERLLRGDIVPLRMELSFARPTNPEMYPADDWGKEILDVANKAGATRARLILSSDRRSAQAEDHSLSNRVRNALGAFHDAGLATVARMHVLEDGIEHPIDLIADRLQSVQDVEMLGRYPSPDQMYAALDTAIGEEREALDAIFGQEGRRLR